MTPRRAAAAGLLLLAIGTAYIVLRPGPRAVQPVSRALNAAVVVPPGGEVCERGVDVPAGTGAVELVISTAGKPGGPLEVMVRKSNAVVARGTDSGGYSDSPVRVTLDGSTRGVRRAQVCVGNPKGPRLALLGSPLSFRGTTQGWIDDQGVPSGPPARVVVNGRRFDQPASRLRMEWQYPAEQSRASFAGAIGRRFGMVKSPGLGAGLMWLAFGLTLAAALAAVTLTVKETERPE